MTSRKRRRKLTQAELRALGATPGLMVRRIGACGRAGQGGTARPRVEGQA
jgi:hypothetical protein